MRSDEQRNESEEKGKAKRRWLRRNKSKNNRRRSGAKTAADDESCLDCSLLNKEIMYSNATVLDIGPKFMAIFIPELAIVRHIWYGEEVEGLTVEWLEATSTLLLSPAGSVRPNRKPGPKELRPLNDIAEVVSPTDLNMDTTNSCGGELQFGCKFEPSFFPLTVRLRSRIPVAVNAAGGGPRDVVARLYVGSYLFSPGVSGSGEM